MPPEGHYRVANPEDFPIEVTSVVVVGDQMTIDYLDEAGEEQQVVYQIRKEE